MNIQPINDLLLIRRIVDDDPTTDWGFLLPPGENHADTPLRGVVLFAGEGRAPKMSGVGKEVIDSLQAMLDALKPYPVDLGEIGFSFDLINRAEDALQRQSEAPDRIPMTVKVGDTVIFSKNGFSTFRIAGEDVIVTQEASIMGIIDSI